MVDFQRAFDTVEHETLFAALPRQRVELAYVHLLNSLYHGQTGRVRGPPLSKVFRIKRGTKQGDPISPKLVNSVLEDVFLNIQTNWRSKGFGIEVGGQWLCNSRFPDDVLLVASSKRELQTMWTTCFQQLPK